MSIPVHAGDGSPDKLLMIKSLRRLTIVLGKLGISGLTSTYPPPNIYSDSLPYAYYGIGLKDAKDLTERFLDAKGITTTAAFGRVRITKSKTSTV